ncbi:hypothetical protein V1511DRAFT_185502 [Dipodascopsis uninucleata]
MSLFADDPETARIRQLIAADYSDAENDDEDDDLQYAGNDVEDDDAMYDVDEDEEDSYNMMGSAGVGSRHSEHYDDDSQVDPYLRRQQILKVRRRDQVVNALGDQIEYQKIGDAGDEENDEVFINDLRGAAGFRSGSGIDKGYVKYRSGRRGKKNRGRVARREQEPSEEVKMLLGLANQAYALSDLDEAERLLAEVIRIDNHVYAAWKTLGEIHKQRGDIPKCLLAWISAGHLRLKDAELWAICGRLSREIGMVDQALYCYNRAILADGTNIECIFERGLVFKEMGNLGKALEAFRKLHDLVPEDMTVVRELASVYVQQRNIPAAAKLYEDILSECQVADDITTEDIPRNASDTLRHNVKSPASRDQFGWSELNILAELYGAQKEWTKAIRLMKYVARWLTFRSDKLLLGNTTNDDDDDDDDDDEYDPSVPAGRDLPLDLRAKLAIYRLKLNNIDIASKHVTALQARAGVSIEETSRYADLFVDVADALMEAEQYESALALYVPVSELDEYGTPAIVLAMGRCLHGLGDFDQAEAAYRTVIEGDQSNLDARIALAEVYEATGRRREALELVNEVMQLRRQQERSRDSSIRHVRDSTIDPLGLSNSVPQSGNIVVGPILGGAASDVPSFIPNIMPGSGSSSSSNLPNGHGFHGVLGNTRSERQRAEELAVEIVGMKVRRLRQYESGLRTGNPVAVSEWLQTASELVDMFTNTKGFYPSDRQQVFRGFSNTARRRAGKQTMSDRLAGMASRLQESLKIEGEEGDRDSRQAATDFRGLGFDEWFRIFMQYAIILAWHEEVEDAYSVLRSARDANVFYQDRERVKVMTMVRIACALHSRDARAAMDDVRGLLSMEEHQFSAEAYRLLLACCSGIPAGNDVFNSAGTQKYLLRQVKGLDSLMSGHAVSGSVKLRDASATSRGGISAEDNKRAREIDASVLLTMYGQVLASSRSYVPSLNYYMRAFALKPRDPMILFSIALAHLHRAMQRQTNNRHGQLVQALSFLFDYAKERVSEPGASEVEAIEVAYNVGRAFHMLGLASLAIIYYNRAIDTSKSLSACFPGKGASTIALEAAYNVQLLYMMSGNFQAALHVGSILVI